MPTSMIRSALVSAILTATAGVCFGQPVQQPAVPRGGLNPDSFYGKETFQGVSVRDSLEAIKKLEDARRMERLQDWNKAADWYQEVIEKFGDRVVPSGTDSKNNIYQYTGIERPVQEQLAKWPPAGLDAYRNRYGAIAGTMFEKAPQGDQETFSRVMKLYFVTEAGKQAGLRLLDLHLENGNFPEAARIGDRLLDWHPTLIVEKPRVLFRTALAYHLAGDVSKAKARADLLRNKFADATGTLFGKDVILSHALDQLLSNAPPVSVAATTGAVRYYPGGNEERSLIPGDKAKPGARLATIDLSPPPVKVNQQQRQEMEAATGRSSGGAPALGVMPVVDSGELYFQDGSRIYAVSLASGVSLPGWMQSYPNSNGQYTINSWSPARNQQHTLTLTDSHVLAIMGVGDRAAQTTGRLGTDAGTRLVCLTRADGKERWVVRPNTMRVPDDQQAVKSLDFSGSPLIVGENVYVIGRGGKNYTSEDCYVMCLDMNTGGYKWSCFIASANNNAMFGQVMSTDNLSHLAYSSGRVYCLTNLGAAAAIDAYAGTIVWLNIYPRDSAGYDPQMGFRGGFNGRGSGPSSVGAWEFNPVIVQEGKVFLLPIDGRKNLMVYDAGTGAEIKRVALDELGGAVNVTLSAILGVDGNLVFMTGSNLVYCIDWAAFDKSKPEQCVQWRTDFAKQMATRWDKTPVSGRGFVTADSVFVCTTTNLYRIDRTINPKTGLPFGKLTDSYPGRDRVWDEGEGPGNILVTGDQIIVAGAKRVNVYADMNLARKRLDDDVAAAPTNAEPRLRYAEVMFVAGKQDVAMEKLQETVALLGGIKSMRQGPERDHLFNDCITFATKLQKDKKAENIEKTLDLVGDLYDMASSAADGDSQQVNYRMSRARFNRDYKQEGSLEAAVKLYQEILTSPKLRTVPLADEDAGGATQAAIVAEKYIGEVIKLKPTAYAAFEKEATDALAAAGNDPSLLKAVAESYPNSTAAAESMTSAAKAYEGQSAYRLAAHTYGQVYRKYAETLEKTKPAIKMRLLEGMARNYLAMKDPVGDRVETAAGRLSAIVYKLGNGDEKLEKALKLPDGQVLADAGAPFKMALKALQAYRTQAVSAKLPDFHLTPAPTEADKAKFLEDLGKWRDAGAVADKKPRLLRDPFNMDQQVEIADIAALISPPPELQRQHSRTDRIAAWTGGNLVVYPVGEKTPAAQSNAFTSPPRALAWIDDRKSMIAWSESEIAFLEGANLAKKWKVDLRALPRIDVIAGGNSGDEAVAARNNDADDQILLNGGMQRGMILRRRVINGRLIQIGGQAAAVANPAAAGPEQIAFVKPVNDRILVSTTGGQLFAINASTGQLAWHTRLAQAAPVDRILANDDFVVCKVTDSSNTQLVIVDTLTGQLVRRLNFSNDSGNVPVNLALAPDGMLVWTQPDRLCGKDLFEPRRELNYDLPAGQDEVGRGPNQPVNVDANGQVFNPIYAGAVQPDQLVISEGRVLAVTHAGKYVSIYSLESGKLLDYKNADGRRVPARLATVGASTGSQSAITDWSVALNVVGQYVYVTTRQSGPVAYNLDDPFNLFWNGTIDSNTLPNLLHNQPMVGQDYFIVLGQPARRGGMAVNPNGGGGVPVVPNVAVAPNAMQPSNTFRVHAYTRSLTKDGRESGRLDHTRDIRDDAGIIDWEPVEGGLYYLGGDKKLHFLKGGRN